MENESGRYDFCPKCGALVKDGVCQSCGWKLPEHEGENTPEVKDRPEPAGQDGGEPQKQAGQQEEGAPAPGREACGNEEPGTEVSGNGTQPRESSRAQRPVGQGIYSSLYCPQEPSEEDAKTQNQNTQQAGACPQNLPQGNYSQGQMYPQNGPQGNYSQGQMYPQNGPQGNYSQGQAYPPNDPQGNYSQGQMYPQSGPQGNYNNQGQMYPQNGPQGNYSQGQSCPPNGPQGSYNQGQMYPQNMPQGAYNQGQRYYTNQPYGANQQNMYPNYNPYQQYPGQKPPMKKSNKVWMIVGITLGVLYLLITFVWVGYCINRTFKALNETMEGTYENAPGGSYDNYGGNSNPNGGYVQPQEPGGNEEDTYVPSPGDMYYYGPCDFINENVDYSFERKTYSNQNNSDNVDIIVNYVLLKGDNIPNLEKLNEAIEKACLFYGEEFPKEYAIYGSSYQAYITPYITYNDEDMVSIVLDEYIVADGMAHTDLYSININVKNGVILDNASLLNIDVDFASEFRKRSIEQNGSDVEGLNRLSDKELCDYLNDSGSIIAYFTPLGMEIGYNYVTENSYGWLTVTYKDYQDYVTKF